MGFARNVQFFCVGICLITGALQLFVGVTAVFMFITMLAVLVCVITYGLQSPAGPEWEAFPKAENVYKEDEGLDAAGKLPASFMRMVPQG